jgi:hypothetical protein
MAVKRLDLAMVAPILHQPLPAEDPNPIAPALPAGPSPADLLGIAAGDAKDRPAYFDTTTHQAAFAAPLLVLGGTSLMDYRDTDGRRTRRALVVVPPSTEERIANACGGAVENLNAALIALAEHGLRALRAERQTLVVRNAIDPHRGERLAWRKIMVPKRGGK